MYEDTRLIELKGISKAFGETQVLHNVDMYIRRREFVTLLGPVRLRKDHDAAHHRRL